MKKSSNIKWTIENIKNGFESFYKEYGRYPTSQEVDMHPKLPSSRQIQRRYGGLPEIRKLLKLDCQENFTKGKHSTERALMINKRAFKIKKNIYNYLISKFGLPFVHREFFFNDDRRTKTDFCVYCSNNEKFLIDVFYPANLKNLNGCLNNKLLTYRGLSIPHTTIFLMMNEQISDDEIKKLMGNKKNKLSSNQFVMTYDQFIKFCDNKERIIGI